MTIQTYLNNRLNEVWDISRVKNLLCKVYRIISSNGRDSWFVDIHRNDQILIVEIDSKYAIYFADGKVIHLLMNILCIEWEMVCGLGMSAEARADHFAVGIDVDFAVKFPSLAELMESVDVDQVKLSFPPFQNKRVLLFHFSIPIHPLM
jgi:hypothetical protein